MQPPKSSKGALHLAKVTFSIIAASVTSLLSGNNDAKGSPLPEQFLPDIEKFRIKSLIPKLVLKQHSSLSQSSLAMHASHRSHSSHRSHVSSSSSGHSSHSSHASHASHYSSSPSATTSNSTLYTPTPPPTTTTNKTPINSLYTPSTVSVAPNVSYYNRVLYLGCEGKDVEEVQKMLISLNYKVPLTGYFGPQTESAVILFQKTNEYKPDGRVDQKIYKALKTAIK